MGQVKRVLYEKKLEKNASDFYCGKQSSELCENFHYHRDAFRFEYSLTEWLGFVQHVQQAVIAWGNMKMPKPTGVNDNSKTVYLASPQDVPAPCETHPYKFVIEEQENVPTIHVHYRNFRWELSLQEWQELVKGIREADEVLRHG